MTMTNKTDIYTLKARSQFLSVAASGNKKPMPGLVVLVRKSEEEGIGLGITVSKRCGGAVDRNRIKRRLRRAAGVVLPEVGKSRHQYVVIGRRAGLGRSYDLMIQDLKTAIITLHTRLDERG